MIVPSLDKNKGKEVLDIFMAVCFRLALDGTLGVGDLCLGDRKALVAMIEAECFAQYYIKTSALDIQDLCDIYDRLVNCVSLRFLHRKELAGEEKKIKDDDGKQEAVNLFSDFMEDDEEEEEENSAKKDGKDGEDDGEEDGKPRKPFDFETDT